MLVEVEVSQLAKSLNAKPFVMVGIPANNEENSIARVILNALKFSDAVIVCDDGSTDYTGHIARRLGADVIRHEKKRGYGAAIASLFKRAKEIGADVLVTLDADGQHDPSEIPVIVEPVLKDEADLVIGSRFVKAGSNDEMPFYRRFGAKFITRLVNGSSKNGISDAQSGFRAYSRKALQQLSVSETGMGASVELLMKARKTGLKVCEVASSCKYHSGELSNSSEHPIIHGASVVMSVIRFIVEEKPLTVLGFPGILFLLTGFAFGVWTLQIYAAEHMIVTNVALAALAFVVIGFFMLTTGIVLYAIQRLSKKITGKGRYA